MLAAMLALSMAHAAPSGVVPGFDDPILYAPEVLPDEQVSGGELRVDGGGALVLEHTDVVVEVSAGLARVTMTQWFANPYDEALEATYLLPLPSTSAVYRMDLVVGDRLIEGVVMEREAAARAYEQARDEGRKAALLEQQRDNLFTQKVAGICPGERVVVTLEYMEQVAFEDGLYELALPTTVGRRYSPPWVEDAAALVTPYSDTGRTVDVVVHIDEGMPLEALWSDSHAIDVIAEDALGAAVGLAPGEDRPDRDFSLTWSLAGEQPRAALLTHREPGEDGYLSLSLEPQLVDDLFQPRPRELIFVIDSSCSMEGRPYDTATAAVLLALSEMGRQDTFNLVRFSNEASALFDEPQPSTRETRAQARAWLERFEGGGTEMDRGLVKALTMPGRPWAMRLVLMLTDGYIGGEEQIFEVVRENLGGSRVFSLGVGSSVNRYLLEGLAELGRGDVSYQLPGTPIADTVDRFYDRIAHPAMSDIRIDWGDAEVFDQYPRRVPDLWAGQPLRVSARYSGEGPTTVRITGLVGVERFELELPVDMPEANLESEAVATLWARRRIRDLERHPRGLSKAEARAEIVETALEHHLVSRYTSLVAIDDEPCACGAATLAFQVPHEVPQGTNGMGMLGGSGYGIGGGAMGYGMGFGSAGHRSVAYGAKVEARASVQGDAIVLGSVDRTTIRKVIERHHNQVRYCYEKRLRLDPTLAGKLVMKFIIAPDGSVSSAIPKLDGLGDPELAACVSAEMLRMRFPMPEGSGVVMVSYPFVFTPAEP